MNEMHFWNINSFCYDIMQIFPRCITVAKNIFVWKAKLHIQNNFDICQNNISQNAYYTWMKMPLYVHAWERISNIALYCIV